MVRKQTRTAPMDKYGWSVAGVSSPLEVLEVPGTAKYAGAAGSSSRGYHKARSRSRRSIAPAILAG